MNRHNSCLAFYFVPHMQCRSTFGTTVVFLSGSLVVKVTSGSALAKAWHNLMTLRSTQYF
eukprot:3036311-Amphidinium_carterae.1